MLQFAAMIEKVTLENQTVRLEPLAEHHVQGLLDAGHFSEIWQYMPVAIQADEHAAGFVAYAQQMHAAGTALAFAMIQPSTGQFIGSTGYWNADLPNRRIEIGFTWITPEHQRTAVNTAGKLLLLTHAFETLELNRVEFKTDALNERSRAALKRIGAVEEGTLRRHMVQPDGRLRDSVYFSVIREEWPKAKTNLERMAGSKPG